MDVFEEPGEDLCKKDTAADLFFFIKFFGVLKPNSGTAI